MKSKKMKSCNISVTDSLEETNPLQITTRLDEKRCLTIYEFGLYISVGRNSALKISKKSNSRVTVGKKILVDRVKFEIWLAEQEEYNNGILL